MTKLEHTSGVAHRQQLRPQAAGALQHVPPALAAASLAISQIVFRRKHLIVVVVVNIEWVIAVGIEGIVVVCIKWIVVIVVSEWVVVPVLVQIILILVHAVIMLVHIAPVLLVHVVAVEIPVVVRIVVVVLLAGDDDPVGVPLLTRQNDPGPP